MKRTRTRVATCSFRARLVEALELELKIKKGETTTDMEFSLDNVNCVGCCGLAPVSTINEEVIGEIIGKKKMEKLVRSIKEE